MALGILRPGADHEVALADQRVQLSRSALNGIVNRATNALLAMELPAGRPVAVYGLNAAEVALAHLAATFAGVCSVPVNALLGADEVRYIVHDSGAGAVFVGPETAGVGVAMAGAAGIPTIGWRCDEHPELIRWDRWVADAPDQEPPTDHPATELLFYTSGTTGYPKGTLSRPPLALRDVAECVAWWQGRLAGPLGAGSTPCLVIG